MRICWFCCKNSNNNEIKNIKSKAIHLEKKFHHQGASECLQDSTHAFLWRWKKSRRLGSFRSFSGGIYFQEQTCKHTYNNCIIQYICMYTKINICIYIYMFLNKHLSQYMYIILLFLVQLVCMIIYISHSKASSSTATDRNTLEALETESGNKQKHPILNTLNGLDGQQNLWHQLSSSTHCKVQNPS